MLTHACGAGMRNMRLATEARIELMEPMQAFPFFRAMSIAFLEPLDPAFAVKLDTGALSDKIRPEPAVKPLLMHILTNEVFSVRAPPNLATGAATAQCAFHVVPPAHPLQQRTAALRPVNCRARLSAAVRHTG